MWHKLMKNYKGWWKDHNSFYHVKCLKENMAVGYARYARCPQCKAIIRKADKRAIEALIKLIGYL